MADPRFYHNRGPWDVAAICAKTGMDLPPLADGAARVSDLASLDGAGPSHLSFFSGAREQAGAFARSRAGFVLVPMEARKLQAPGVLLRAASVPHAFAAIAGMFYPDKASVPAEAGVDPSARLGRDVVLGPGVVIGAAAEIGERSRIGAKTVIGPGVTIGQDCEIGSTVSISHAHVGDRVIVRSGAQIGQPGFGFSSLGRVIIQDGAEIGAACAIDRGSLGDTVIGEGARIEKGVRIGPDALIGRLCVMAADLGPGSVAPDGPAGQNSGGVPAKPIREGSGRFTP